MKPASPPVALRVTLPSGPRAQPLSRLAPAAPGRAGAGQSVTVNATATGRATATATATRTTPPAHLGSDLPPTHRGSELPRAGVLRHQGASGQLALELRRR